MSLTQNLEELLHFLELLKPAEKFIAVVMPVFFLDRLVTYEGDLNYFSKAIAKLKGKKETKVLPFLECSCSPLAYVFWKI